MITDVIDSLKPLSIRQKKNLWNLVCQDKHLWKRINKELDKKDKGKK